LPAATESELAATGFVNLAASVLVIGLAPCPAKARLAQKSRSPLVNTHTEFMSLFVPVWISHVSMTGIDTGPTKILP
jgi:hypothetical protein